MILFRKRKLLNNKSLFIKGGWNRPDPPMEIGKPNVRVNSIFETNTFVYSDTDKEYLMSNHEENIGPFGAIKMFLNYFVQYLFYLSCMMILYYYTKSYGLENKYIGLYYFTKPTTNIYTNKPIIELLNEKDYAGTKLKTTDGKVAFKNLNDENYNDINIKQNKADIEEINNIKNEFKNSIDKLWEQSV